MVDCPSGCQTMARRPRGRRAFNLIELVSVLVIVALLAAAGFMRYGSSTVGNLAGEGFARKLALDLLQSRRRTIATGDNHYLLLAPSAANVASYKIYRRAAGGGQRAGYLDDRRPRRLEPVRPAGSRHDVPQ